MKTDIAPTQFVSRPRDSERLTRQAPRVVGPDQDPRSARARLRTERVGCRRRQPDPPRSRGDQRDDPQPVVAARPHGPRGPPPDPLRDRASTTRLLPVLAPPVRARGTTVSTRSTRGRASGMGRLLNFGPDPDRAHGLRRVAERDAVLRDAGQPAEHDRRLHVRPDRRAAVHLHDRSPTRADRRRVRGAVLVHGQGRSRDLLPRRRVGALRGRLGTRRRAREDEGEPRLRRGPRVDRTARRPRARRRPALRASGHRQDPHGRSGRGRDG